MSLHRNVQTKHSANGIHCEHFAFEISSLWGCILNVKLEKKKNQRYERKINTYHILSLYCIHIYNIYQSCCCVMLLVMMFLQFLCDICINIFLLCFNIICVPIFISKAYIFTSYDFWWCSCHIHLLQPVAMWTSFVFLSFPLTLKFLNFLQPIYCCFVCG